MQINVIHLRKENFDIGTKQYDAALIREKNIEHQRLTHSLDIRIWDGIIDTPPHKAICKMHKMIVADAKERNLPMVCIAEDDFNMTCEGAFEYYLENMPDDFQLYHGMIYSGEIQENRILNGWSGMTLYIVKCHFYSEFLEVPDDRNIDRFLGMKAWENNYRVCPEYVCEQINGHSFHLDRQQKYEYLLLDKKMFGRELNSNLKLE